jgi:hypothetical protein
MPTKRRTPKMTAHRVTAAAVEAFRAGDRMRLHTLLDLRPWQVSPLEVDTSHGEGEATGWGHSFVLARELRAVLLRGD